MLNAVIPGILILCASAKPNPQHPKQDWSNELKLWVRGNIGRFPKVERAKFTKFIHSNLVPKQDLAHLFQSPYIVFESHGDAYVWKFNAKADDQYLVYLNPHTGEHPSSEHAWLFIVDQAGKVLSQNEFDTGWRMYSKSAIYKNVPGVMTKC